MSEQVATAEAATGITEAAPPREPGAAGAGITGAQITGERAAEPEQQVAIQDLLVEEVSIDGMCGVY
ncbi:MAG TPA: mycofactocin precursor MftA [Streptosporangiaceae bacterium]